MSNTIDTNSLLLQLRSLARDSGMASVEGAPRAQPTARIEPADDVEPTDFAALVGNSLRAVNERSAEARRLTNAYEAGNPSVELADVMIAVQKARVSFEALTQVRNKMVSAYQDVMNTPL